LHKQTPTFNGNSDELNDAFFNKLLNRNQFDEIFKERMQYSTESQDSAKKNYHLTEI